MRAELYFNYSVSGDLNLNYPLFHQGLLVTNEIKVFIRPWCHKKHLTPPDRTPKTLDEPPDKTLLTPYETCVTPAETCVTPDSPSLHVFLNQRCSAIMPYFARHNISPGINRGDHMERSTSIGMLVFYTNLSQLRTL